MKNSTQNLETLRREKRLLLKEKERRLGLNDLYFFNKEILDCEDFIEGLHGELCEFVSNREGKRKKLILMPRGSFKSTAVTIGMSLWEAVKNPNIRILISSEKHTNSAKFLGAIKGICESNKKFKESCIPVPSLLWVSHLFPLKCFPLKNHLF